MSVIDDKYKALGAKQSFLGVPISPEIPTLDGLGLYRQYKGGSICWSAKTGAHEAHGAIHAKWMELGAYKGFLGLPLTDETPLPMAKGGLTTSRGARSIGRRRRGRMRSTETSEPNGWSWVRSRVR